VSLQKENGAAAVELAILLPFLAVLVFGIIEVGLLYIISRSLRMPVGKGHGLR